MQFYVYDSEYEPNQARPVGSIKDASYIIKHCDCWFYSGRDCADRLKYTDVKVDRGHDVKLCGRIEDELKPNSTVVEVECMEPLHGFGVHLEKYDSAVRRHPHLSLCEVIVIGYIYVGE